MEAAEADRLFKDMFEPAVAGGRTEEGRILCGNLPIRCVLLFNTQRPDVLFVILAEFFL